MTATEEKVRELQSCVGDLMIVIVDHVSASVEKDKIIEAGEAIQSDLESLLRFVVRRFIGVV